MRRVLYLFVAIMFVFAVVGCGNVSTTSTEEVVSDSTQVEMPVENTSVEVVEETN